MDPVNKWLLWISFLIISVGIVTYGVGSIGRYETVVITDSDGHHYVYRTNTKTGEIDGRAVDPNSFFDKNGNPHRYPRKFDEKPLYSGYNNNYSDRYRKDQ